MRYVVWALLLFSIFQTPVHAAEIDEISMKTYVSITPVPTSVPPTSTPTQPSNPYPSNTKCGMCSEKKVILNEPTNTSPTSTPSPTETIKIQSVQSATTNTLQQPSPTSSTLRQAQGRTSLTPTPTKQPAVLGESTKKETAQKKITLKAVIINLAIEAFFNFFR